MSAMVKAVDAETPAAIGLLEKMVDINSGTMNFAGVIAVKDVIAPQIEALGFKVDGCRWRASMDALGIWSQNMLVLPGRVNAGSGCC